MNASETGYKVSLIGDASVGKTSIISHYTDNSFELGNTATVGVSNITAEISYNGQKVPINAWDTAGQERFRSLIPLYTRDSAVVLLVFSMDSLSSFESLDEWYSKLRNDFKIECQFFWLPIKLMWRNFM